MVALVGPGVLEGADDPLADFDRLYRTYGDRLVRHCRRHLNQHGDPEDAAHEALLKAWTARERFDRGRPVWPWLATIARNTCIDQLRRHAPRQLDLWSEPAPPTPEDVVVGTAEEALLLRSALADLPPLACEALQLRDVEGLAYEEIAARQARSEGAVRNAVARARKHLRASLEQAPPVSALAPVAVLGGFCRSLRRLWSRGRASAGQHAGQFGQAVESAATPWLSAAPAAGQLVLVATMALTTAVLPQQATTADGGPVAHASADGTSTTTAAHQDAGAGTPRRSPGLVDAGGPVDVVAPEPGAVVDPLGRTTVEAPDAIGPALGAPEVDLAAPPAAQLLPTDALTGVEPAPVDAALPSPSTPVDPELPSPAP